MRRIPPRCRALPRSRAICGTAPGTSRSSRSVRKCRCARRGAARNQWTSRPRRLLPSRGARSVRGAGPPPNPLRPDQPARQHSAQLWTPGPLDQERPGADAHPRDVSRQRTGGRTRGLRASRARHSRSRAGASVHAGETLRFGSAPPRPGPAPGWSLRAIIRRSLCACAQPVPVRPSRPGARWTQPGLPNVWIATTLPLKRTGNSCSVRTCRPTFEPPPNRQRRVCLGASAGAAPPRRSRRYCRPAIKRR